MKSGYLVLKELNTSIYTRLELTLTLHLVSENAVRIPISDSASRGKGTELSQDPVEMKSREWFLKVVPWIGGRIISMQHLPSGNLMSIICLLKYCLW